MYRLLNGGVERRLVVLIAGTFLALVLLWLGFRGSAPQLARDFEECVEQVQARLPSQAELPSNDVRASMTDCNVRFAGRRKAGGGYTYYDFMQDRNFDIAGANPTAEERKQIDHAYMAFLDTQRRKDVSAELARRLNEQFRADVEVVRQPVGPPLVLIPRNPLLAAAKRPADRSKSARCEEGSLTCSWVKFSAAVKNAFASTSKVKP